MFLINVLSVYVIFAINCHLVLSEGPLWDTFDAINERAVVKFADKQYINSQIAFGRYNRTTYITNFTVDIFSQLPENVEVHIIGYEFKNNEYKRSVIEIRRILCSYWHNEYQTLFKKSVRNCVFMEECPFVKGHYYCINWTMDKTTMTFRPFGERWMFRGMLKRGTKLYFEVEWYVNIKRNVNYYKRRRN